MCVFNIINVIIDIFLIDRFEFLLLSELIVHLINIRLILQ